MANLNWSGIFPAMLTPFHEDGELNFEILFHLTVKYFEISIQK